MIKIILVGAGEWLKRTYPWIKDTFFEIIGIWDNDSKKHGQRVGDYIICAPSDTYIGKGIDVVITSTYVEDIKNQFMQMGYHASTIHDIWWLHFCRMNAFYKMNDICLGKGEQKAIEHTRKFGLTTYNIDLSKEYRESTIECDFDENNNRYFCLHNGKKMYMREGDDKAYAVGYYNKLRKEQDVCSPHCYKTFVVNQRYDCIVDAGCAEGIFSLDVIDRCKELFLIEPDSAWFEACQYTFGSKNNTTVYMYENELGDTVAENKITLDYLLEAYINKKNQSILIKMDIEGAEEDALIGASKLLCSENEITVIACSYHHANAYENIMSIFKQYGFDIDCSERSMFFRPEYEMNTINHSKELSNNTDLNYRLRHGVIVGYKNSRRI